MDKELELFLSHTQKLGLRQSKKRDLIVKAFLQTGEHLSAADLLKIVQKNDQTIGYTTVYRTLKLISNCGLADTVDFNDGVKRFERKVGREYHAHFICTNCGNNFEVFDKNIEGLSSRLAQEKGFLAQKHRLEIFGLCRNCS